MSVWAFKVKRYPDGRILKHKAHLNAHGGMQRWGVDYWETYAPVVNWISVRLLLVLLIIHKLDTTSIEFVFSIPTSIEERCVYGIAVWVRVWNAWTICAEAEEKPL